MVKQTNLTLSQSDALDCFLSSKRKLTYSLKFTSRFPSNFFKFSNEFAANIIEITLIETKLIKYYEFIASLSNLKNLKNLQIINCSFDSEVGSARDDLSLKITELFLMNVGKHVMKDYEISHLLSISPKLIKFSCDVTEYNDSGKTICDYLVNPKLTKSLKDLKIFGIRSDLLYEFFRTKHLDLETFYWKTYNTVRCIKEIEMFLIGQRNLKIMNFYFFPGYFKDICSSINFKEISEDLIVKNSWKDFYSRISV